MGPVSLTHWGWLTHICDSDLTIIGSDNGLLPGWRQAIIWTNAGILLTAPLRMNFNEILIEIQTFFFKKMNLKISAKWHLFHLHFNMLTHWGRDKMAAISQTTHSNTFSWMKLLRISIEISLNFVPKGAINNIPALVQIMATRHSGNKPLSEPMLVYLPTHICVTRPQWVNKH